MKAFKITCGWILLLIAAWVLGYALIGLRADFPPADRQAICGDDLLRDPPFRQRWSARPVVGLIRVYTEKPSRFRKGFLAFRLLGTENVGVEVRQTLFPLLTFGARAPGEWAGCQLPDASLQGKWSLRPHSRAGLTVTCRGALE